MNLKPIRRYRYRLARTSGLIKNNPVVVMGMALPFVIVPSSSLKSAVMMSAFILAATLPCATLAPLLNKKLPTVFMVPVYSIISMGFVMLTSYALKSYAVLIDGLGLYIPLAAINSIMIETSAINPRNTPFEGFREALGMCMGFAMVACGIGTMREILSSRTIWGISFGIYPIDVSGVTLPFFGFILIGFLNALCRSIDRMIIRNILSREPVYYDDSENDEVVRPAGVIEEEAADVADKAGEQA